MNFGTPLFGNKKITIPQDANVIFVADMFVEDYVGGAELTTEALISSSPLKVFKLKAKDVTLDLLRDGLNKYWVFGNFTSMNMGLIPTIVANLRYSVLEYDYKFCKHRLPEKHESMEGTKCTCEDSEQGKMISSFFLGSDVIWWMSEAQQHVQHTRFPFLKDRENVVLSSVFDEEFFMAMKVLRNKYENQPRNKWIVLGSQSWVKGFDQAEKWCKDNNKDYEVVWNLPYGDLLERLAQAEGFVYLPNGSDTCPRMVIEAKLLGCKLHINEHVQHSKEEWFDTDDLVAIEEYLYSARDRFWTLTKKLASDQPTISGYTTTLNCVSQKYPFEESIRSMLAFCDEVCVVDGGSSDETLERLALLKYGPRFADALTGSTLPFVKQVIHEVVAQGFPDTFYNGWVGDSRLQVKVIPRDWNHPRFAVFDGLQKAEARKMCTSDFCWQQDSDEIVHENDGQKVKDLVKQFPKAVNLVALPVVEYWGGQDKVRCDVNPWKWRISRNLPNITHGIPKQFRRTDKDGNLCGSPGTDGCDMIDAQTFEPIPFLNFVTKEVEQARHAAITGNPDALVAYQAWFNDAIKALPGVHHFSWFDLERKIHTYKNYWTKHWESLTGKEYVDDEKSNMMFDVPWSQVTDEMIKQRAKELSEIGGWIWHQKWNGYKTPWITIEVSIPAVMKGL